MKRNSNSKILSNLTKFKKINQKINYFVVIILITINLHLFFLNERILLLHNRKYMYIRFKVTLMYLLNPVMPKKGRE